MEAIETDLDWVHAHTRLLVRAIGWDRKGRDSSFLLGGRDLREAEDWLAQGAAKEPRPTPLHVEYITASRRAATGRQRVIFGAVTFGLIVAVVLDLLAWGQRNVALDAQATAQAEANARATSQAQAELERDRAEHQARLATSRQLAAQSRAVLKEYPQRSVLLAVEALKVTMRAGESRVPADGEALRQALATIGGHGLDGHELELGAFRGISDIAISPDGHWLVTGSNDTTARLWDLTASDPTANSIVLDGHRAPIWDIAIGPDSRWLVTGAGLGAACLWDLAASDSATNPIVLHGHEGIATTVASSPDGHWLVTGDQGGTTRLWDLAASNLVTEPIVLHKHTETIWDVAISPDSRWLATGSGDGTTRLWDLTAPATNPIVLRGQEEWISDVAFSPDGHWLATAK